ncbi:MAG TPA: hypothetical protein VFC56_14185 [Stellaceae bacterium]|nr:hypothetical protein [Stellaceae bacterium]
MRDLPTSLDLLALARELLLDGLAPLLPPERKRDAHLIATAMAIAAREAAGREWTGDILWTLAEFYGELTPHPGPLPACGEREHAPPPAPLAPFTGRGRAPREAGEGEGQSSGLLARFAADLRNGAFETSRSRERAARAILWRLTIEKLREGNPHFLAANGFHDADGQEI